MSGQVTDAVTGLRIYGATVSVPGNSVVTDSAGDYSLSYVAPGNPTITATDPSYSTATATATVTSGGTTANVNIQMTPLTGTISGKVTDAVTGAAISGATVYELGRSVTTDSGGNYSMTNAVIGL